MDFESVDEARRTSGPSHKKISNLLGDEVLTVRLYQTPFSRSLEVMAARGQSLR